MAAVEVSPQRRLARRRGDGYSTCAETPGEERRTFQRPTLEGVGTASLQTASFRRRNAEAARLRSGEAEADAVLQGSMSLPRSGGPKCALLEERACVRVSELRARERMPRRQETGQQSTRTTRERVRVLITGGRIQRRIQALAKEIRRDFQAEPLHLVSVLKGGVFFLTDLARNIPGEVSFDFIAVSSYGQKTHSSGQARLTRDLDSSIEGKTVIVVEDILDTGMTLQYLLRLFQQRKPKHLRVAVLLDKPDRRIAAVHADYVGFSIPNEFVVGYGLDYAERYRNLPYVGVLLLGPGLKEKPAED